MTIVKRSCGHCDKFEYNFSNTEELLLELSPCGKCPQPTTRELMTKFYQELRNRGVYVSPISKILGRINQPWPSLPMRR